MWFDLVDEFQDEAFHGVADHFRDIIHLTLECSVEDWRSYSAPPPLIQLATRLRKKFLIFLARRESQQDPVPQKALIAAFPVRQRPLSSAAPAPPLTPEEIASRRIEARLQHMLRYSGWMATDEMDFSIQPATLFCAPHNLLPEYGAYTHIIWFVIHNNHWLQFECFRQGDRSRFLASVPIQQRGSYVPLIQLLMDDIGLDRDSIPIDFVDQTMPRDLCGYYLLANIFYRLGLRSPPLDVRDQMLSQGLHGRLIDRVRLEARRTWMRAEGLPDFVIFAANIRDWFLLRVKTNRFPDHVLAAGAIDVTMDPGQNRPRPQAGSAAAATAGKPAASSSAAKGVDSVWVSDPWRSALTIWSMNASLFMKLSVLQYCVSLEAAYLFGRRARAIETYDYDEDWEDTAWENWDGDSEVQELASMFAGRFNAVVRSNPRSGYSMTASTYWPRLAHRQSEDKKNDGSFKRWLLGAGFEASALFDRNKCMISLPHAKRTTRGTRGGRKNRGADRATISDGEQDMAWQDGFFDPPHGLGSAEAMDLEEEVISHLREHGECDMGALRQVNDLGRRFNEVFFHKSKVNDGSWKKWLASMDGVEVAVDPKVAAYHGNKPTVVRLK
ncbi:cAMP-dependent protein kinase regulatory subunit [Durusdinium trenchii]|uniref:cAMP-dependent protein kinase regulatory subunit n=1 Tax=Durusdinium trenchii TaxID=1381693 RepID=A0ABP0KZJ7_9DINO